MRNGISRYRRFLNPIEVGQLVTIKPSVNYVGRSSMIIGIRVEAENIQTGKSIHCNSGYFTMVAKDLSGNHVQVPTLILSNHEDIRRFYNCLKMISLKKDKNLHEEIFDYKSNDAIENLKNFNVKIDF